MKLFLVSLCLLVSLSVVSQTIEVEGHVRDSERQDLIGATIRCFTVDTLLVESTVTDSKGDFKLKISGVKQPFHLKIGYLGYKEMTLILNPTDENLVRVGDVTLSRNSVLVQEITVVGSQTVRTEEKTMIYPTREQLRHAYDRNSLLRAMTIPGVSIDIYDQTPTYMGREIMFCIDGREATEDEVNNLNPRDIKRIDFYTNGSTDYPDADVVLDYVLKERDYAGTVAVNGRHNLNKPTGSGRGVTQYFQGKSEFALSMADNYDCYSNSNSANFMNTVYGFPDATVINTAQEQPSEKNSNNLRTYFNYIYKDKKQSIYTSLRLNHTKNTNDIWSRQTFSNTTEACTMQENRFSANLSPALSLWYERALKNDQRLRMDWYGSFGNNDFMRWYAYRTDDVITSAYDNSTEEYSWYGRFKINYTKTFKNRSTFNVEANQDFTRTDDRNTREGAVSDVYLNRANTQLYLTYNYKIKNRLNLRLRLAERLSFSQTGVDTYFEHMFVPSFQMTYMYKEHTLQMVAETSGASPGISNLTATEYRRNIYEVSVGNPELKDWRKYQIGAIYSWGVDRFFLGAGFVFGGDYRSPYTNIEYDAGRGLFVRQQRSSGNSLSQNYELQLQYSIIPQKLTIEVYGNYKHEKLAYWKTIYGDSYDVSIDCYFFHKGWSLSAGYSPKHSYMEKSGVKIEASGGFDFNVGYAIKGWNIQFRALSPFMKTTFKGWYERDAYSQVNEARYFRTYDNMFELTVNYRFTYGKKKHKFHNVEIKDINQSTILE